jgi:alanine-synthesizing transaminase
VTLDDIYLGNGASELIVMATNALLDNGDELLLPRPTIRCGRPPPACPAAPRALHVRRANGWMPDLDDIRAGSRRTKGIVVINPNNPTGALYSRSCCCRSWMAREHGLVIFADEVYDKVLYDDAKHTAAGQPVQDVLT